MAPQGQLRADAAANRIELLRAAEHSFERYGLDVSLHTVAARAQVGVGTLYRHFPDRDALLLDLMESIAAEYDQLMEALDQDGTPGEHQGSWSASHCGGLLVSYLQVALDVNERHPIVGELWSRVQRDHPGLEMPSKWKNRAIVAFRDALADGLLRSDVEFADVALLPRLLTALSPVPPPTRAALAQRFLAIFLAGLSPATANMPLPSAPVSSAIIDRFLGGANNSGEPLAETPVIV